MPPKKKPSSPLIELISSSPKDNRSDHTPKRADFTHANWDDLVITDEQHAEIWKKFNETSQWGGRTKTARTPRSPKQRKDKSPLRPNLKPKAKTKRVNVGSEGKTPTHVRRFSETSSHHSSPPRTSPVRAKAKSVPSFRGKQHPALKGKNIEFEYAISDGVNANEVFELRSQLETLGPDRLKLHQLNRIDRDLKRARETDDLVDMYFNGIYDVYSHLLFVMSNGSSDDIKRALCELYFTAHELNADITSDSLAFPLQSKESVIDYHLYSLSRDEIVEKLKPLVDSWRDGTKEARRNKQLRDSIAEYRALRDEVIHLKYTANPKMRSLLQRMKKLEHECGYRNMDVDCNFTYISTLANIAAGKGVLNKNTGYVSIMGILNDKSRITDANVKRIKSYIASRLDAYARGDNVDPDEIGWIRLLSKLGENEFDTVTGLPIETTDIYVDTFNEPVAGMNKPIDPFRDPRVPFANKVVSAKVLSAYYSLLSDIDYSDKSDIELQALAIQRASLESASVHEETEEERIRRVATEMLADFESDDEDENQEEDEREKWLEFPSEDEAEEDDFE